MRRQQRILITAAEGVVKLSYANRGCDNKEGHPKMAFSSTFPDSALPYGMALTPKTFDRFVVSVGAPNVKLTMFFVLSVGMMVS